MSEMRSIAAVTFLVLGLLQGLNVAVAEESSMDGVIRTIFLLAAAAVFYFWMMRDERTADEAAEESMDEIEKQLDVVKEAIKDAKESAKESVEDALEDAGIEPKEDKIEESTPTPEPVAQKVEEVPAPEPEPVPTRVEEPASKIIVEVKEEAPAVQAVGEPDDLTRVEGIGPKYRDILVGAGIDTFAKVAAMSEDEIVQLVKDNGGRKSASMSTWAEQAKLAADGDWDGLAKLQAELSGGRK